MPAQIIWRQSDAAPPMDTGEVHVWRIPLDACSRTRPEALEAVLSADERLRWRRFAKASPGMRYAFTRASLRRILGLYLETPPETLKLAYGPFGKPGLAEPAGGTEFNLSHSGPLALLALTRERPVGIDLEPIRPRRNLMGIARRVFPRALAGHIETLEGTDQQQAFFRAWTAMEARAKADGGGVFRAPLAPDGVWRLWHFVPADGYLAAAAVSAMPRERIDVKYLTLA